jgi:hypothetical protein
MPFLGALHTCQVLADTDGIDALVQLEQPSMMLTLSDSGKFLRGWSPIDGTLVFEELVYEGEPPEAADATMLTVVPDAAGEGEAAVVVLTGRYELLVCV